MIKKSAIPEPSVGRGDSEDIAYYYWAMWDEDEDDIEAHIGFWQTKDGRIVVNAFQSNKNIRGRDMLRWLGANDNKIIVVEVIYQAIGFYEVMQKESLIEQWEIAEGWGNKLEQDSVPVEFKTAAIAA